MGAEGLEQVRAAIADEDWPRALAAALDAWRIDRTADLADLIDRITDRCELPQPPHTRGALHRWWVTHARDADPVMIGALLAKFSQRLYSCDEPRVAMQARWPGNAVMTALETLSPPRYLVQWAANRGETYALAVPNWVERVAAICTWPDDPRITRVLGGLVCDHNAMIQAEGGDGPWPVIAERLRTLRDPRLGALLAKRGIDPFRRIARQRALESLLEETAPATTPANPDVAALAPALELPDLEAQLAPLWQEVAEHPDDDGPRLVLADALLAAGDNRGELIVLQCSPDPEYPNRAEVQANRLINREWSRWMGDLALVIVRRGTVMRRGMLEAIRVGHTATPPWAWDEIEDHRELGVVREVRAAQISPARFARLVSVLPRFPRMLQIDAHEVIEALLATGGRRAIEEVYFAPINNQVAYDRARPRFEDTYRMLAQLAPDLTRLDLGSLWWHGERYVGLQEMSPQRYVEMIELIKSLFPRLARIRVEHHTLRTEARPLVDAMPDVQVVVGKLAY